MIDRLKKILESGISEAIKGQAESVNQSFVMKGKGDAFREVLLVITELEKKEDGKDTADAKEAAEK